MTAIEQAALDTFGMAVAADEIARKPSATLAKKERATVRWLIWAAAQAMATGELCNINVARVAAQHLKSRYIL
jgi:hypothetical protein